MVLTATAMPGTGAGTGGWPWLTRTAWKDYLTRAGNYLPGVYVRPRRLCAGRVTRGSGG